MNVEEVRRALLAGEPVDWSEIDALDLTDDELAGVDSHIAAYFGDPLPDGWQEGVAAVLEHADDVASAPSSAARDLVRRMRERLTSIGEALPAWNWVFDVTPVALRGVPSEVTRRGHVAATLDADAFVIPVEISVLSDGSRLVVDLVGIEDEELAARLRVAVGEADVVVLLPTRIASGYVAFETEWSHALPEHLAVTLAEPER